MLAAIPGSWTTALPNAQRDPSPAEVPMAPPRPTVAVSTVAPSCMTTTSEIMPLSGK